MSYTINPYNFYNLWGWTNHTSMPQACCEKRKKKKENNSIFSFIILLLFFLKDPKKNLVQKKGLKCHKPIFPTKNIKRKQKKKFAAELKKKIKERN